jgi:hypothetical protein
LFPLHLDVIKEDSLRMRGVRGNDSEATAEVREPE